MENNRLIVSASPHITSNVSTRLIMVSVALALVPTLAASSIIFGWRVLLLTGVTVATCVCFELCWCVIMKKPIAIGDFSAVVTGLILAFNLPPNFPLWMASIGSFVAIVIVKQLFGGIGFNFANPALVARIVLQISFTGKMIQYTTPASFSGVAGVAGATPLSSGNLSGVPFMDLLLGTHGGVLGETAALTLLLGGLFLIAIRVISPVIPLVTLGGVFGFKFLLGFFGLAGQGGLSAAMAGLGTVSYDAVVYLLGGGLLLGAFFMATDYVTSPFTAKGKIIFALGFALLTVTIREWGNMAEGVSYSLLLMNLLVPYINAVSRNKPHGVTRQAKKAEKTGKEAV